MMAATNAVNAALNRNRKRKQESTSANGTSRTNLILEKLANEAKHKPKLYMRGLGRN